MSAMKFIFLTAAIISCTCPGECWVSFQWSAYKAFTMDANWDEALHNCESEGAYLVVISSEEEQQFVSSLQDICDSTWIGLNDIEDEGIWEWTITDETTDYTNWKSGQPNDWNGQDCVVIWCTESNQWQDLSCTDVLPVHICEKEGQNDFNANTVVNTPGPSPCLNPDALVELTLYSKLTRSTIECFQLCVSFDQCTAFQTQQVTTNKVMCHVLQDQGDNTQYEQEPINCSLIVIV